MKKVKKLGISKLVLGGLLAAFMTCGVSAQEEQSSPISGAEDALGTLSQTEKPGASLESVKDNGSIAQDQIMGARFARFFKAKGNLDPWDLNGVPIDARTLSQIKAQLDKLSPEQKTKLQQETTKALESLSKTERQPLVANLERANAVPGGGFLVTLGLMAALGIIGLVRWLKAGRPSMSRSQKAFAIGTSIAVAGPPAVSIPLLLAIHGGPTMAATPWDFAVAIGITVGMLILGTRVAKWYEKRK